ncbi:hypothetical protein [Sulfitobacter sp.]|uniref:hypothetical protein n=1 Tax=Sulfitobacter sp. TaxID=1903071 RepID=UPI0035665692
MPHIKEIMTAAGTLGCAIGIGFVMQSSDAANERYGAASDAAVQERELQALDADTTMLEVQDITLTSADFSIGELGNSVRLPETDIQVIKTAAPEIAAPVPGASPDVVGAECDITANARPMAAAMVNVTLDAPCLPNERVTVHHNGMIFTQTTSRTGALDIAVPALAETAVFVFAFGNGDGAVAQAMVEDIADFNRVVLQWKGDTGFQIHALEFGSDYNGGGHVWSGKPRDIASAITGEGGFMTMNGDLSAADPLLAEVYTFPAAMETAGGAVELSVETEVIAANCGQEIEARSLEMRGTRGTKTKDLSLAVPDCDAIGSFLVLNNLLEDLKVASN